MRTRSFEDGSAKNRIELDETVERVPGNSLGERGMAGGMGRAAGTRQGWLLNP